MDPQSRNDPVTSALQRESLPPSEWCHLLDLVRDREPGVVLIITDETRQNFFLQKKDPSHPEPTCRGSLSFFGGSIEPSDIDPLQALIRELDEELELGEKRSLLVEKIEPFSARLELHNPLLDQSYACFAYAVALGTEQFQSLRLAVETGEIKVNEGLPYFAKRSELVWNNRLGFVYSLEQILDEYLSQSSGHKE